MATLAARTDLVGYPEPLERALGEIVALLKSDYLLSERTIGLLLLQEDAGVTALVQEREAERFPDIQRIISECKSRYSKPLSYYIVMSRQQAVNNLVGRAVTQVPPRRRSVAHVLGDLTMRPLTGIPILALVLYFGLYQFVGVFGAGVMVNFIEKTVFGEYINPIAVQIVEAIIPWEIVRDLFVGQYGIVTLGVRYAVAIILPIVGTFFIAFSILEDTGYLPRLALLIDRVFKAIGLNGRAVIPMVLGLGCDTMATIVTRVLETRRERVIATLLLALAIPCSAQLGVILGILSGNPMALLLWAGFVLTVFLVVGFLAARVVPGQRPSFYMEVPPLRWPKPGNVLVKTYTRMEWYLAEVLPLFLWASVALWLGSVTGLLNVAVGAVEPLVGFIGLPKETAVAFLFGFFRRDYGAAGLYDLQNVMTGQQMLVAAVTLTLFVPCVAQFGVMLKERGTRTALAIFTFVSLFAFLVGFLVNTALTAVGAAL